MRTIDEVAQEYVNTCTRAGELQYQIAIKIPNELEKLNNKIFDLDKESKKIMETQSQQKAAEQAATDITPKTLGE